jgi:hypothetical protein
METLDFFTAREVNQKYSVQFGFHAMFFRFFEENLFLNLPFLFTENTIRLASDYQQIGFGQKYH